MTSAVCPCCGACGLGEPGAYEICGRCGWEDDPSQAAHPAMAGGANDLSLDAARAWWAARGEPLPGCADVCDFLRRAQSRHEARAVAVKNLADTPKDPDAGGV